MDIDRVYLVHNVEGVWDGVMCKLGNALVHKTSYFWHRNSIRVRISRGTLWKWFEMIGKVEEDPI